MDEKRNYFLIYECYFSCVERNLAVSTHHPLHTKWLNRPLASSDKSGNLGHLDGIMLGMLSHVQHKTMEQWSVSFGPLTLYKGPIYVPPSETPAYKCVTP